MSTDEFWSQVRRTQDRWAQRSARRETHRSDLAEFGVLGANEQHRVTRRLARLGTDWGLATTVERTPAVAAAGRSLPGVSPEHFGADVLGLERLIGRSDLIGVGFLEAGYRAARSVGRVVLGGRAGYGTGFLIAPGLLLTNHHVLPGREEAADAVVQFDYQDAVDGTPMTPVAFRLEPHRFFTSSQQLDFSAVAVAERDQHGAEVSAFGWLPLREAEGKVLLGELTNIIQHPNAEPKQLALRENRVVDLLDDFVQYETDTAAGSSGAPVFNDQWEVVALHHSGVPSTDADGSLLAVGGARWTPDMGEAQLAWKANEGVRGSSVLRALREQRLDGVGGEWRMRLFEQAAPVPAPRAPDRTPTSPPARDPGHRAHWTVPVEITVDVAAPRPELDDQVDVGSYADGSEPAAVRADLRAALTDLEAARTRTYWDERADAEARDRCYAGIAGSGRAPSLGELAALVTEAHLRQPAYQPMRLLYPWVDVHQDGQLRSIYSGKAVAPEEFIRADAAAEAARIRRQSERLRHEMAAGLFQLEQEFDLLEAALPYNCEHVVPQSWFGKREPMRGDLHHLFACESGCNSFRGNTPYADFSDYEEKVRHACGRREELGFEPASGKGPVARATLYFLVRYAGIVGDTPKELAAERLGVLLSWHTQDPVSTYEKHRNAAIAEIQGNRNPFVDHPEWAEQIDLAAAWARPIRA